MNRLHWHCREKTHLSSLVFGTSCSAFTQNDDVAVVSNTCSGHVPENGRLGYLSQQLLEGPEFRKMSIARTRRSIRRYKEEKQEALQTCRGDGHMTRRRIHAPLFSPPAVFSGCNKQEFRLQKNKKRTSRGSSSGRRTETASGIIALSALIFSPSHNRTRCAGRSGTEHHKRKETQIGQRRFRGPVAGDGGNIYIYSRYDTHRRHYFILNCIFICIHLVVASPYI